MRNYILGRVLQLLPMLVGMSIIVFVAMRVIPGDTVIVMLGGEANVSAERIEEIRAQYGLKDPLPVQYVRWLGDVVTGNFGVSIRTGRPVATELLRRVPVTLELVVVSTLIALLLGVSLGTLSAMRQYSWLDSLARVLGLLGLSVPAFWLGALLILFVALPTGLFPVSGFIPVSDGPLLNLRSVFLPALCLAVSSMAILMRMTRSSMLEVLRQEYVTVAHAKGLAPHRVLLVHSLKNALIPIVTVAALQVGHLLGGAIVIETVFAIPGMGTFVVNAIFQRDYNAVQAGILFIAAAFTLINLVTDVLYAYLDPRIRFS